MRIRHGSNSGEDRSGSDNNGGGDGRSGREDNGAVVGVKKEMKSVEVKLDVMIIVLEEVIVKVTEHWWWKW